MPGARKNPALSPAAKSALAYWPQISRAAALGLTTADLWSDIREAAEDIGLASPGVTVQGVSQLRGMAAGIERTADRLARAADSRRLIGDFVATPPWARTPGERKAAAMFNVRFQHTVIRNGEEVTEWRTTKFSGRLPRTVGELRRLVEGDAVQLARKYPSEHVGVSGLQLFAV